MPRMRTLSVGHGIDILLISPGSTSLVDNDIVDVNILSGSHPIHLVAWNQVGQQGEISFNLRILGDELINLLSLGHSRTQSSKTWIRHLPHRELRSGHKGRSARQCQCNCRHQGTLRAGHPAPASGNRRILLRRPPAMHIQQGTQEDRDQNRVVMPVLPIPVVVNGTQETPGNCWHDDPEPGGCHTNDAGP